jgi:hypothetical protein
MEIGFGYIFVSAGITILSLGIVILSLMSYKDQRNSKLLFITFAFLVFLIKGLVMSLSLFFTELTSLTTSIYFIGLDVVTLFIFFVSTLKR